MQGKHFECLGSCICFLAGKLMYICTSVAYRSTEFHDGLLINVVKNISQYVCTFFLFPSSFPLSLTLFISFLFLSLSLSPSLPLSLSFPPSHLHIVRYCLDCNAVFRLHCGWVLFSWRTKMCVFVCSVTVLISDLA